MSSGNLMKHKGFQGTVEVSIEDEVLFGKIVCINDLVTYEADSARELKAAFIDAVDDYIETCEEIGRSPDKPMSGSFNVRVGTEMHRQAFIASLDAGVTLNEFVKSAVTEKLHRKSDKMNLHIHFDKQLSVSSDFGQGTRIDFQESGFDFRKTSLGRSH